MSPVCRMEKVAALASGRFQIAAGRGVGRGRAVLSAMNAHDDVTRDNNTKPLPAPIVAMGRGRGWLLGLS